MSEEQNPLSEREMEILRLVATGASNRQIARELFISPNTVKVHLRNIFSKLEVESRTEATMVAVRQGWVVINEAAAEAAAPSTPAEPVARIPLWKRIAFFVTAALVLAVFLVDHVSTARPAVQTVNALTDYQELPSSSIRREETSRWTARPPLAVPRARMAVTAIEGLIYVIGGDTATGVTAAMDVYDSITGDWASLAAKPTAVANAGAAVIEGKIYVPGGYMADGQVTAVLEIYDPATDAWETGSPLPTPLCAYAIAAVNDQLCLFGGWDGTEYVGSVYVYDPASDQWSSRAAMSFARGFAGAGVIEGVVYVVGGYDGARELALCEAYDPRTDTWSSCAPMSVGRGGLGVAVVGPTLYAVGGGWESYLAFNERYEPDADVWHAFETPVTGQWRNLGLAATDVNLYAIGGWSGEYLAVHEEYQALFRIFIPASP
jgi:DNA-binding CsgD family transcriptional regulator